MKKLFKKGQMVRVAYEGNLYSTYADMAEKLNAERWVSNRNPEKLNDDYFIVNSSKHDDDSVIVYLVENVGGEQFLYGECGLEESEKKQLGYTTKDSGERVLYESGFNRDSIKGKPRYDLIPTEMITRLAGLYARGAEKYGDENWKLADTPEEIQRFQQSAWRHFIQWIEGQTDEDHASAIMWNVIAFEWITKHKNEVKDNKG